MDMGRIKKPLATAIDRDLYDQVDEWIKLNHPWRKVDVVETALREFLRKQAGSHDEDGKKESK